MKMKQILCALLCAAALLSLFACQNGGDSDATSSAVTTTAPTVTTTEPAVTTTEEVTTEPQITSDEPNVTTEPPVTTEQVTTTEPPVTTEPSVSLPEGATPLSAEQLQEIEDFLNNTDNNGFAHDNFYARPEEVDLLWALYNGGGMAIFSDSWSKEEIEDFLKSGGYSEFYTSAFKIKRTDIDAFLIEKLGISFESFDQTIPRFRYLEAYDAYYTFRSDFDWLEVIVLSGYIDAEGCYVVDYNDEFIPRARVTLRKTETGYQFISNVNVGVDD